MPIRDTNLIVCRCQTCGSSLRIAAALAGKRLSCPRCQATLQILSGPTATPQPTASNQLQSPRPVAPPPRFNAPPQGSAGARVSLIGDCLPWAGIASLALFLLVVPPFGWSVGRAEVLAWASLGFVAGFIGAWGLCRPIGRRDVLTSIGAFFFTGILGVTLLLTFQSIAVISARLPKNDYSLLAVALRTIGDGYSLIYLSPGLERPLGLVATSIIGTISVGLCEEFVKLIPVMAVILWGRNRASQNVVFLGAASGLGFGIVEGIKYGYELYFANNLPSSIYMFRFLGLASLHSMWTICGTFLLLKMRDALILARKGRPERLIWFAFAAPVIATVPHGFYNALCFCEIRALAFVVALLSVAAATAATINVRHNSTIVRTLSGNLEN